MKRDRGNGRDHRFNCQTARSFPGGPPGRTRNPDACAVTRSGFRVRDCGAPRNDGGRAPSPAFFGRPRVSRHSLPHRGLPNEGSGAPAGAGACEAPAGGTSYDRPVPPLRSGRNAPSGAPLRRSAMRGPRFRYVDQPRPSASSWRRVVVPGSGAPPSPGSARLRWPRTRGTASIDGGVSPLGRPGEHGGVSPPLSHRCSHLTASHDDAPRRAGHKDYIQYKGPVNSPLKRICAALRQRDCSFEP